MCNFKPVIFSLLYLFQLNVYATDNGFPPQNSSDEARVIIRIKRNIQGPSFTQSRYEAAVPETLDIGGSVLEVSAADRDADVSIVDTVTALRQLRLLK